MVRRLSAAFLACALALWPTLVRPAAAGVNGIAVNDNYATNEEQLLHVDAPGVLANDGPAEYPNRCVDLPNVNVEGLGGTLNIQADGSFDFQPQANLYGETTFAYKMGINQGGGCPEGGPSNDGIVTILIRPVNDPPTVEVDSACDGGVTVAEDSGAYDNAGHCVEMTSFGPPIENSQNFEAWLVSNNNDGLFSQQPSIAQVDGTFGRLSFAPKANAAGTATVSVRGRDNGGTTNGGNDTSSAVTFQIRITNTNDPPTANPDGFVAVLNQTLNVGSPGLLANDSDIDGDSLTAIKASNPSHGVVTVAADGGFSYTPASGYLGPDAFSYKVSDGTAQSATKVVSINVLAIPPVNTPTPAPTLAPTEVPSLEPGATESPLPSESAALGESPGASASAGAGTSPSPGASTVPGDPVADEGGFPLFAIAALLLLVSLLAIAAGFYLRGRGAVTADGYDDVDPQPGARA